VRIEPELVDAVVAGQPLPEESGNRGDVLGKIVEWCLGCRRRACRTPVIIDFADNCGDLFSRRATARISE
jgi:hypothetical protein